MESTEPEDERSVPEESPASGSRFRGWLRLLVGLIFLAVSGLAWMIRNPLGVLRALAGLIGFLWAGLVYVAAFVAFRPIRHAALLRLCMFTSWHAGAVRYANKLLGWAEHSPTNWNTGNAIHRAHSALGMIALERGDVELAKRELLKSGHTPGSPQLDTFGPNMRLASRLLSEGESDTVLEYFRLCGRFWEDRGTLEQWAACIERGDEPEFGGNLIY